MDDARKWFGGSGVRRHHLGTMKDPDEVVGNDDLDVVAH
jgi:hypothetical protein